MNDPPPKLKHPTGWFAAGREVTHALELLSDGAFKLYIYLCLHANRRTGQLCADQTRLAKGVGKSRRSVVTYLEELRQTGVCSIHAAVNQHVGGQIGICDAFWPYERVQPSTSAETLPAFIEQTKRLLAARRCIGTAFAEADARLAASLFDRHIPIEDVEHAVLLGCARKYVTLINRRRGELIASFSYFANVIEEVRELKMPAEYWHHIQMRVARLEQQWTQMTTAGKSATAAPILG
jgi:Helix-turn-helix domain